MTEAEFAELVAGIDPNDPAALAKLLEHPFVQKQMQQAAERQASASASLAETLETLYAVGLVERKWRKLPACHQPGGSGADRKLEAYATYGIHPGVAEAGRELAVAEVQQAVDAELGEYWISAYQQGIQTEMQGGGGLIRLAGMRAAPYLMRASRWEEASTLLEHVLQRDMSPATVAALLPQLRHIAAATEGTPLALIDAGVLANALLAAGRRQEAEAMMLDIAARAEQQGQFRVASAMLGDVIYIMTDTGRAEAALDVVERMKQATTSAGLGPWTQLGNECMRLQLLGQLGRHEEVLAEVQRHRETIRRLSLGEGSAGEDKDEDPAEQTGESGAGDTDGDATFAERKATIEEAVVAWNVRETLLDNGLHSAIALERWDKALALNAEVLASTKSRHASELEQVSTRYNDYGPLLGLERFDDARRLLLDCRLVFEEHNHIEYLGKVFTALADLESQLGHFDLAAAAEHNALRYKYLTGDPGECAISHFNLASYLSAAASRGTGAGSRSQEETALAHRLAATLIGFQMQAGALLIRIRTLARQLTTLSPDSPARGLTVADGSGFDAMVAIVEQIEGVRFTELFARLPTTRAASGPEALAQVLALASRPEEETGSGGEMSAEMQALLAPLFAAAEAGEDLQPHLETIRQQLLQNAPDQAAAINQFLQQLTETLRLNDQ